MVPGEFTFMYYFSTCFKLVSCIFYRIVNMHLDWYLRGGLVSECTSADVVHVS